MEINKVSRILSINTINYEPYKSVERKLKRINKDSGKTFEEVLKANITRIRALES